MTPRFRDLHGDFLQFELFPESANACSASHSSRTLMACTAPRSQSRSPRNIPDRRAGGVLDMGWGVTFAETYSHQFQEWLNWHPAAGFLDRTRYEVLNFAVAAYSPLQRLETFRRKAK